jgi:prolyl-tRNA synthetase
MFTRNFVFTNDPRYPAGLIHKSVNKVLSMPGKEGRVTIALSTDESVEVKLLRWEGLHQIVMLAYGIRCITAHGAVAQTLGTKGAISAAKAFTDADIGPAVDEGAAPTPKQEEGAEAVRTQLNDLLQQIKDERHEYMPDEITVVNVHRIYKCFARTATHAACVAVKDLVSKEGWDKIQCRRLYKKDKHRDQSKTDSLWWWNVKTVD